MMLVLKFLIFIKLKEFTTSEHLRKQEKVLIAFVTF